MPIVTTSDLSRAPGHVLERVARGERLLVCRHKRPVATLQPLDGFLFQPLTGTTRDVFGWPIGGVADEAGKLSDLQRTLLRDCIWNGAIRLGWAASGLSGPELHRALEEMVVTGLLRPTYRGKELTARGLALREWLIRSVGYADAPELGGSMLGFKPPRPPQG